MFHVRVSFLKKTSTVLPWNQRGLIHATLKQSRPLQRCNKVSKPFHQDPLFATPKIPEPLQQNVLQPFHRNPPTTTPKIPETIQQNILKPFHQDPPTVTPTIPEPYARYIHLEFVADRSNLEFLVHQRDELSSSLHVLNAFLFFFSLRGWVLKWLLVVAAVSCCPSVIKKRGCSKVGTVDEIKLRQETAVSRKLLVFFCADRINWILTSYYSIHGSLIF